MRKPGEFVSEHVDGAVNMPLDFINECITQLDKDKEYYVHCAGGYRSAAASSLIHSALNGKVTVFDLGEAVKDFQKQSKNES